MGIHESLRFAKKVPIPSYRQRALVLLSSMPQAESKKPAAVLNVMLTLPWYRFDGFQIGKRSRKRFGCRQ
jgi:hypothetical protein